MWSSHEPPLHVSPLLWELPNRHSSHRFHADKIQTLHPGRPERRLPGAPSTIWMEWHPGMPRACRFRRFYVKIHHNRVLPVSNHHCFASLVRTGVDLLMGHVRRHIDEISWLSFPAQFQVISPPHSYAAPHNIEHSL